MKQQQVVKIYFIYRSSMSLPAQLIRARRMRQHCSIIPECGCSRCGPSVYLFLLGRPIIAAEMLNVDASLPGGQQAAVSVGAIRRTPALRSVRPAGRGAVLRRL